MKTTLLLLFFIANIYEALAQSPPPISLTVGGTLNTSGPIPIVVGGTTYYHEDTIYLDCSVDSLIVSIPTGVFGSSFPGAIWTTSSGLSVEPLSLPTIAILRLPPNRVDGLVRAAYIFGGVGSLPIVVNIKQKIPAPNLTLFPNVCQGSSNTFHATTNYDYQSTYPMNLVWSGSGGATVNGFTNYIQPAVTFGDVTVANGSESGAYISVKAVVPGCPGNESSAASVWLGKPVVSLYFQDSTSLGSGDPVNSLNYAYGPTSIFWDPFSLNAPGTASNVSWNASPNIGYASGTNLHTYSLEMNPGTTITINPSASNSCGTISAGSKTFTRPAYLRAYPNPVEDVLSVTFTKDATPESLPNKILLIGEKSLSTLQEFSLSNIARSNKTNEGIKVKMNGLPTGIYFLHVYYADRKTPDVHKIIKL